MLPWLFMLPYIKRWHRYRYMSEALAKQHKTLMSCGNKCFSHSTGDDKSLVNIWNNEKISENSIKEIFEFIYIALFSLSFFLFYLFLFFLLLSLPFSLSSIFSPLYLLSSLSFLYSYSVFCITLGLT